MLNYIKLKKYKIQKELLNYSISKDFANLKKFAFYKKNFKKPFVILKK